MALTNNSNNNHGVPNGDSAISNSGIGFNNMSLNQFTHNGSHDGNSFMSNTLTSNSYNNVINNQSQQMKNNNINTNNATNNGATINSSNGQNTSSLYQEYVYLSSNELTKALRNSNLTPTQKASILSEIANLKSSYANGTATGNNNNNNTSGNGNNSGMGIGSNGNGSGNNGTHETATTETTNGGVSTSPSNSKNLSHVPCKFYRQGACQAGNSCPFSHATDTLQDVSPCKYFQKGNCKFGVKCALAHILPDGRRVNPKSLQQVYQQKQQQQNSNSQQNQQFLRTRRSSGPASLMNSTSSPSSSISNSSFNGNNYGNVEPIAISSSNYSIGGGTANNLAHSSNSIGTPNNGYSGSKSPNPRISTSQTAPSTSSNQFHATSPFAASIWSNPNQSNGNGSSSTTPTSSFANLNPLQSSGNSNNTNNSVTASSSVDQRQFYTTATLNNGANGINRTLSSPAYSYTSGRPSLFSSLNNSNNSMAQQQQQQQQHHHHQQQQQQLQQQQRYINQLMAHSNSDSAIIDDDDLPNTNFNNMGSMHINGNGYGNHKLNGGGDDVVDFVPSSLSDLLTPQELQRQRRNSRKNSSGDVDNRLIYGFNGLSMSSLNMNPASNPIGVNGVSEDDIQFIMDDG